MNRIAICFLAVFLCGRVIAQSDNLLTNGNFEEDAANVGFPDHWSSNQPDSIETARLSGSEGRIVQVAKNASSLIQTIPANALQSEGTLHLSLRVRGPNAQVSAGIRAKDTKGKSRTFSFIKSRAVSQDWETFTAVVSLPKGTKFSEAELILGKDGGDGTLYLDNVILTSGNLGAEAFKVVHEMREWRYLVRKAEQISDTSLKKKVIARSEEVGILLSRKTESALAAVPDLQKERLAFSLSVLKAASKENMFAARLSNPLERLNPESLAWLQNKESQLQTILSGEEALLGIVIANIQSEAADIRIQAFVDGAPIEARLRRQVFLDTWYTRGETRVADPLVLCPRSDDGWAVRIDTAEEAAFLIEIPKLDAGQHVVEIRLSSGEHSQVLKSSITTLTATAPADGDRLFEYMAFCYPGQSFMRDPIEDSIRDMERLGVTAFEFPYLPKIQLKKNGELISIQWTGFHEQWLAALKTSPLAIVLFIEPGMKTLKDENGAAIPFGSPEWERAYREILISFVAVAERHGIDRNRLINIPKDEAFSKDQTGAPDEHMRLAIQSFRISKETVPEMRTMATVTYYTYYADLIALLPYADIVLPHWPYPEKLTRYASPSYNPREAWLREIKPLLFQEREKRSLEVWSYHVANGKANDPLKYNLAYPTLAATAGLTGASHWAYAAQSGSTWDDTDGKILDYILAYDGFEKHPLNEQWNVTCEHIVPSIRWFAVREGLNDARLLRYLIAQSKSSQVEELLKEIRKVAGDDFYGTDALTYDWYSRYRVKLRNIYESIVRDNRSHEN